LIVEYKIHISMKTIAHIHPFFPARGRRGAGRVLAGWVWVMFAGLLLSSLAGAVGSSAPLERGLAHDAAVAFHYGAAPPWQELRAFDVAVVDPDHWPPAGMAAAPDMRKTRLAAYVSVGEVQPTRDYFKKMPPAWRVGENAAWGSQRIDQSAAGWPAFFVEQVIEPLWQRGFRMFFMDTLDAYHAFATTPEQRAVQEAGLVAVMKALKERHPEARLIFNRGFEILDRTRDQVVAVAAESLFQGYDAAKNVYRPVPEADRLWLQGQLERVKQEFGLPVIVIDYVSADRREQARSTAQLIRQAGYIPWVATGDLATLGVGQIEVMPRRVLMVHSPQADEYGLRELPVVRAASMPLQYLGYVPEYVDLHHLPTGALAGSYAGVVLWLSGNERPVDLKALTVWLEQRVGERIPFAVIDQLGVLLNTPLGRKLGVVRGTTPAGLAPVKILQRDAMVGFERAPHPVTHEFEGLKLEQGTPLLILDKAGVSQVAVAVTPWGGYAMAPYAWDTLPTEEESRWVIDPFRFLGAALRLPAMPVPDVTTESGRRLLLVHMDGDGFVSRSELPGNLYAGELVRDRVVRKYPWPMTLSVIEAELSPQGLYPQSSFQLEAVAREIFAAPHVEIASHSYSHPFFWGKAASSAGTGEGYHLPVPSYDFDLQREIEGSIRYIESRLAPPGKKVKLFLWTGDCLPGRDALEWTQRLGVMNMNGGDTIMTRSRPTLTQVEGLGVGYSGGLFQVFAPNQNENVYTENWTGPYYGFERVIETFELTEAPRRLKPINIYFHTYITTKHAGMRSLDKVFSWAQKQESQPVFASEYAQKVLDFRDVTVARSAQGWRIRGMNHLRTLRLPAQLGVPDLLHSQGVAGFRDTGASGKENASAEGRYLHLTGGVDEIDLRLTAVASPAPRLLSANARIERFQQAQGRMRWDLAAHVPLEFSLINAARCRIRVGGREIAPSRQLGEISHYRLSSHVARPLEAICAH
jgi:uncharacterized protein (TIGR01370 family)